MLYFYVKANVNKNVCDPKVKINETLELHTNLDMSALVFFKKHQMYIMRLGCFDWITRINVFHTWFAIVTGFWHVLNKQTRSNLTLLIRDINIFLLCKPDIALELNFSTFPLKTNTVL